MASSSMKASCDGGRGGPGPHVPARGVPLAAVLVLITTIAVLTAVLCSARNRVTFDERYRPRSGWNAPPADTPPPGIRWVDPLAVFCAIGFFGFLGTAIGAGIGLRQPGPFRAFLLGSVVGLLAGSAAGFLVVCPPRTEVVFCGCTVILAAALALRFGQTGVI